MTSHRMLFSAISRLYISQTMKHRKKPNTFLFSARLEFLFFQQKMSNFRPLQQTHSKISGYATENEVVVMSGNNGTRNKSRLPAISRGCRKSRDPNQCRCSATTKIPRAHLHRQKLAIGKITGVTQLNAAALGYFLHSRDQRLGLSNSNSANPGCKNKPLSIEAERASRRGKAASIKAQHPLTNALLKGQTQTSFNDVER